MEFRLLGVLEALDHGLPVSLGGPKQRALLAMLLLNANRAVSTDRIVDGLWGEDPPLRAAATVHVYVSKLRKVLEPDRRPNADPTVLVTKAPGYCLSVDRDDVDLFRFEDLVDAARTLDREGCVIGAAVVYDEALELWREAPLADLAGEYFAGFEVTRLEELRVGVFEDRIDADLALGRDVELLPELEGLVASHPYRERLRRQYILALYRASQQAEALAAFQAARKTLVDDLGLEPGRELRELESAILVHDPDLDAIEPAPIGADAIRRVLMVCCRAEPDTATVDAIVIEAQTSGRRGEEALRRAIDHARATRMSRSMDAATATRLELDRSQRAIADDALDRRRRHALRSRRSMRAATATGLSPCPYRGLLRFEPEDTDWYFGRERLVADLVATVASSRVVSVVGASGSGKSSLTRAGLVAALRDDALPESSTWPQLLITPGADPMLELARALAPVCHAASAGQVRDQLLDDPESLTAFTARTLGGGKGVSSVLLVVDQLEEVFTVCRDEALRDRFLDVLVGAANDPEAPTKVVAAIRADYFGSCASHPAFADLLGSTSVLVGPMRPDEVQRAIVEPARLAGLVFEDGLVDRILDDVGSEPGALPLLETALLETWDRRTGTMMTIEGYEAAGGVHGAVAHLAEEVFGRMSANEQDLARALLLRLAEPGVGGDDVRRRAALDELLVDEAHAAVLANLVEHRLVVTGDATAEVAHEALLREWPRLREWLDEDREGRRTQRALAVAAQDWSTRGEDDDLLFRGTRLAAALDVADAHPANVNPVEREFLAASRARQDRELHEARRTAHRFRQLTGALAVLLVLALVAGGFSLVQRARANRNADQAERRVRVSDSARLATEARTLAGQDVDRSVLLAVEAYRLHHSFFTQETLGLVLAASPRGLERSIAVKAHGVATNLSRDGRLLAVPDTDGTVRLVDVNTGELVHVLEASGNGEAVATRFSNDGRYVSSGSTVGTVTVWEVATGHIVGQPLIAGGGGPAYGVFDPSDSSRIFIARHDGIVTLWDLDAAQVVPRSLFEVPAATKSTVPVLLTISGDGTKLMVGDSDAGMPTSRSQVWDVVRGVPLATVPGAVGAFSTDGSVVVTTITGRVQRWDAVTGEPVGTPIVPDSPAGPLAALSPDGHSVAFATLDNRVWVFDLETGREADAPLRLHTSLTLVSFLADGRLFSRSDQHVAISRPDNTEGGSLTRVVASYALPGQLPVFSADSRRVLTTNYADGAGIVWNPRTGAPVATVPVPGGAGAAFVDLSPNLRTALLPQRSGSMRLWDWRRSEPIGEIPLDPQSRLATYWWSPDGKVLALVYDDGRVMLWATANRHPLKQLAQLEPAGQPDVVDPDTADPSITSVVFTPDHRRVVVIREASAAATVFDTATGRRLQVVDLPNEYSMPAASISADGRTLAVSVANKPPNSGGAVALYNIATGTERSRIELASPSDGLALVRGERGVVTVNGDAGTMQLWNRASERRVLSVPTSSQILPFFQTSPDGHRVVVMTKTGNAIVWNVDTTHWEELACELAGRSLTAAEWHQALPRYPYAPACRT
jgi:DNA-binding SARP family transcriptional activator/WD40 repeat protein